MTGRKTVKDNSGSEPADGDNVESNPEDGTKPVPNGRSSGTADAENRDGSNLKAECDGTDGLVGAGEQEHWVKRSGYTGTGDGGNAGTRDPQMQEAREELLDQFYGTLRIMYLAAQHVQRAASPQVCEQHAYIRAALETQNRTWGGAYEIEQLLAFVMTDEQVAAELPRRMAEVKARNLEFATELERQFEASRKLLEGNEADDAQRERSRMNMRYILQRLLNDLQWFYKQRIRKHEAAKRLSIRVSALFLIAFLFFFSLLFIHSSSGLLKTTSAAKASQGAPPKAEAKS